MGAFDIQSLPPVICGAEYQVVIDPTGNASEGLPLMLDRLSVRKLFAQAIILDPDQDYVWQRFDGVLLTFGGTRNAQSSAALMKHLYVERITVNGRWVFVGCRLQNLSVAAADEDNLRIAQLRGQVSYLCDYAYDTGDTFTGSTATYTELTSTALGCDLTDSWLLLRRVDLSINWQRDGSKMSRVAAFPGVSSLSLQGLLKGLPPDSVQYMTHRVAETYSTATISEAVTGVGVATQTTTQAYNQLQLLEISDSIEPLSETRFARAKSLTFQLSPMMNTSGSNKSAQWYF